jgi:hypothetical protein
MASVARTASSGLIPAKCPIAGAADAQPELGPVARHRRDDRGVLDA